MTFPELSQLTAAARTAGIETLLQLSITAQLLRRGESTFVSLANSLNVSEEAIAYACAKMEKGATRTAVCRQAVGFSIVRLTPEAEQTFRRILHTQPAAA